MTAHRILCPIDFSLASEQTMRVAARLSAEWQQELVVAYACYMPRSAFTGTARLPEAMMQQLVEEDELALVDAAQSAGELGASSVSATLFSGPPGEEIVEALNEDPLFDLVVMSTHGRTGLRRVVMGSVTEHVIRHAPCSVLAMRRDTILDDSGFRHVLCALDVSVSSRHALLYAANLVERDIGRITPMQVNESMVDAPVTVTVREIANAIGRSRTVDLVILAGDATSRSRARLARIATNVLRTTSCPVLVARPRE